VGFGQKYLACLLGFSSVREILAQMRVGCQPYSSFRNFEIFKLLDFVGTLNCCASHLMAI